MPQIVSLQIGMPTERHYINNHDGEDKVWRSGIFKEPVDGPVYLGKEDFAGDAQADLKNHGGPDKAVLLYAESHYAYWRRVLPQLDWVYGGFGENLTVTEINEDKVSLGDIFAIGDVRVEVSQPRHPCWKLARRWQQKDLAARVQQNGFSGWYVRVLQEGSVEAGQKLTLLERPHPEWTISRVFDIIYNLERDVEESLALAHCPAYAHKMRDSILQKFG
ncbi:MAG: MOSC domain-containing protein [Chloroflexota bacterium]|nr:MOSC domain-containing protein [Anaerolineae bacterium]